MYMKLAILVLLMAGQLSAMQQITSEHQATAAQIFLGNWKNDTHETFQLYTYTYAAVYPQQPSQFSGCRKPTIVSKKTMLAELQPNINQDSKKFLGIEVTAPFMANAVNEVYIQPANSDAHILLKIYKRYEQAFYNEIKLRASDGRDLKQEILSENLKIYIHGKIVQPLNESTISFSNEPLHTLSQ